MRDGALAPAVRVTKTSALHALAAGLLILSTCVPAAHAQEAGAAVEVTILAINDFHGNLMPPPGGIQINNPSDRAKKMTVPAGGSEHMAALVKQLRAGRKNTVFVAAGDLIGASPLLSSLFHDEPTIDSLSLMGLDLSSVGNHEFDKGRNELLRMQYGGCHPDGGCRGPHPFQGARFRYLAANVIENATGKTLFPAYDIRNFDGIPVAFIGLTLTDTPRIVTPSGTAGLEFRDEAETVNALVPELRERGVEAIVVLVHEGGIPSGGYNECGVTGDIVDIVKKLDKAVGVVVSGHTHQAYNCVIDGRVVTSAHRYGTLVTKIDLRLDARSRRLISATADNVIVRTDGPVDAEQTALIAPYDEFAKPLANRVVGAITADLTRRPTRAGESVFGDIIADAQLAATRGDEDGGATISFTNPGGIRIDLLKKADGAVTFADLFSAQPFRNTLVTLTLTGLQLKRALEQQWSDPSDPHILQVSKGFSYRWDGTRPDGARVPIEGIMINGQPVEPAGKYRVTVNGFLASGGDYFTVFTEGTERKIGALDLDALVRYFGASSPISPGAPNRIARLD
jgi:5'-nucleotidase